MMHDPRTQVVVDLAAYRDMLDADHEDCCEVPIKSRRARWLGVAENAAHALLFLVGVVALCAVVLTMAPLIAVAAWLRAWVTP
jgi:hypothetical protein